MKDALLKKVTNTKINEGEILQREEQRFNSDIGKQAIYPVESPIQLVIQEYKLEQLSFVPDSAQSAIDLGFLLLHEIFNMLQDESSTDIRLQNIIAILKGQNMKIFKSKLMTRVRQIAVAESESRFSLPKDNVQLQKIGRIFKMNEVRDCYMTQEEFGQIKNKDKHKIFKPNRFADQYVSLESKVKVQAMLSQHKELKSKGIYIQKPLVWPDKRDLSKASIRLSLEDRKTGRQRAIYIMSLPYAINLKNHTILQRILNQDPNKKAKINVLKSIWKVKQAETFYNSFLKPFIRNVSVSKEFGNRNEMLKIQVKNFLKEKFPNMYDSNLGTDKKYTFADNRHYSFKRVSKEEINVDLEVSKHLFATTLAKPEYELPALSEILKNKKQLHLKSQFEKINSVLSGDPSQLKQFLDSYQPVIRASNATDNNKSNFVSIVLKNSRLVLHFRKLVILNLVEKLDNDLKDSDINELIFLVECGIEKGNLKTSSPSLVNEIHDSYLSFDIDASMKVNLVGLQNLRFKVENSLDQSVLVDTVINLHEEVDFIDLENPLFKEVELNYKGCTVNSVLHCVLVLIPKNLEIAHLTLNPDLIDVNFDRFMDIYKKAQNYKEYRNNFFPEKYFNSKASSQNSDYLYFLNNMIIKDTPYHNHQQNLLCNTQQIDDFQTLAFILANMIGKSYKFSELVKLTVSQVKNRDKEKINHFFELTMHTLSCFSPASRFFMHKIIFDNFNKQFINVRPIVDYLAFHEPMIKGLTEEINVFLSGPFDYLKPDQKHLIHKLVFNTYLLFENNVLENNNCPISFSKNHILIVINYVAINHRELSEEQLQIIIINQIFSNQNMGNYTMDNQLMYIDSMILYFKVLLKKIYPDFYRKIVSQMMSFDAILAKAFLNSYASYFETINYNRYNDLKYVFQSIFYIFDESFQFLQKLKDTGIAFGSLFDIIFFMQALVSNFHLFDDLSPNKFSSLIETIIRKEAKNLRGVLNKIVKYLGFVSDQNFAKKEYMFFKSTIAIEHENRSVAYKNLMLNLRTLKISSQTVKEIIEKELLKNDAFCLRVLTLYKTKQNSSFKTKSKAEEDEDEVRIPNLIQEDAYFEIANDFEYNATEHLDNVPKKKIINYNGSLMYLHNLDYKLIENNFGNIGIRANFNNIEEINREELSKILNKYVKVSDELSREIYEDMLTISSSERVSLTKLITVLICSHTENHAEILENLIFFAQSLTNIIFTNSKGIFNEVIMYIIDEVYNLVPFTYFSDFMHNLIENHNETNYCRVKSASIILESDVIDVTQTCVKHFITNTYLSGKPALSFGDIFCKDLALIMADIAAFEDLEPELDKFYLYLEVECQQKLQFHTIPFKITLNPETRVFSSRADPLYFEKETSVANVMDDKVLAHYFKNSPFCFYNEFTSLKLPVNYLNMPLVFNLKAKKAKFFTINVKFVMNSNAKPSSNLTRWKFRNPDTDVLVNFAKNTVNVEVDHTSFFLPLGSLYNLVTNLALDKLEEEDMFKFIKLNAERQTFVTSKNKDAAPETYLFDLVAVEEAIKTSSTCMFTVSIKV